MGCCGQGRRPKIRRLTERENFLKNSLRYLQIYRDADPVKIEKKTLVNYHMKIHMMHTGHIKRRPVNNNLIAMLNTLHAKFVKEMIKRKIKHTTPLT